MKKRTFCNRTVDLFERFGHKATSSDFTELIKTFVAVTAAVKTKEAEKKKKLENRLIHFY